MAASTTPTGAKSSSVNVIHIIDSDDEPDISHNISLDRQGSGKISLATCFAKEEGKNLDNNHAQNNKEKLDFGEDILFTANTKRKRPCNVVMSESESDQDDDGMSNSVTSANLEVDKVTDSQMPRRRLQTLRKLVSKNRDNKMSSVRPHKVKYQQSIPKNDDDDLGVDLSYSEEDNLSDFIVDDVDASDCEDISDKSQEESNSDLDANSSSSQDLQDNNKDTYVQDASDRQGSGNISLSTCTVAERGEDSKSNYAQKSEENSDLGEDYSCTVVPKRKQARNVVLSESENDDEDDDLPISKLIRKHVEEVSVDDLVNAVDDAAADIDDDDDDDDDMPISQVIRKKKASRRRLKRLTKCVSKSNDDKTSLCFPTNNDAHDDDDDDEELEEDISNSEGENLSGFIVDDSDVSEINSNKSQDECNGDADSDDSNISQDLPDHSKDSDSQDVSDGEIDLVKILSKIKREKGQKIKWEDEHDMLKEFGNDAVLCMKAVCVLYRQEVLGDQRYEETFGRDGRGFSRHDTARGCALGRFLTDDSPYDGLKKTVEELEEYNPEGVKTCGTLAFKYSKQIFEIFKNKEDPNFC
ncbi:hypothetical protein MTR_1g028620 [Medicago truncatula]|nr:hypothetical protein MTR_1g028620 [Medicago truncatula]